MRRALAERWAAVSALHDGIDYPRDELEQAWKQVLFNQFHDILPGSAIEPSYDDARDQLGEATAIAKRIITRAHNMLARQVDIPIDVGTHPVAGLQSAPVAGSADIDMQYGMQPTGVHVTDAERRRCI